MKLAWLIMLGACGNPPPAQHASEPVTPATYLSVDDLAARGFTLTKVSETETLVCGADCVCLKQLECNGPGGQCFTLESNLDGFRQALANDERPVRCEIADTGKLCDLSYFRFEGDIYRWETRYFGVDGRLIGQRNGTDYGEFCGGKANLQYAGKIFGCKAAARDVQIICSDHHHERPVQIPIDLFEPPQR